MNPEIGSIIPFGEYKWRVLDVQGSEALLITEEVIEQRNYNEQYTDVTWETCDLRKYLNGEFLRKFTQEQQGRIVEKKIPNSKNRWYSTKGGNDTRDKIFLLSLEEVDKYFGDSGDYLNKRKKEITNAYFIVLSYYLSNSYDSDRVANYGSEGACWWWLRSPGAASNSAAKVGEDGDVLVGGAMVNFDDNGCGVRPALWLKV